MGLDITAYSRLKHVGRHEKDPSLNEGEPGGLSDWCYYDNHVDAFAYACFPSSFRGLPVVGEDTSGDTAFVYAGCMEITQETKTHGFHAGSYGGYNRWRSNLAAQFNPQAEGEPTPLGIRTSSEPDPAKPFYELIWFADNEGCIGPDAAADLLADFRQHRAAYQPVGDWDPFDDWGRAFELAADGGLIRFH